MTDLPEACDFCELPRDEERDEEFVKLYLGDPPQPDRITVRDVGRRRDTERHSKSAQGRVLFETLQGHPQFEVVGKDIVEEVRAVGGDVHWTADPSEMSRTRLETEMHHDKVGVALEVFPEAREVEPDAMVCQECAEMFRNLGQE